MRRTLAFVSALCAILFCPLALAQERLALVIGNDAYQDVPQLKKAVNDARAMAETLGALGFDVISAHDANRREMNQKVQEFVGRIDPGDVAAVFYAGHGVEISGENFLLPIDIPDARPGQEGFVKAEAVSLNSILDRLRGRQARLNIVFLDACRNNPFAADGSRSLGASRGLARINAPEGTFVMYSADAGQAALDRLSEDDRHPNSVFTRTLIPLMKQPGNDLVDMAREVRRQVRKLALSVSHEQTPAYYDAVLGTFEFVPGMDGTQVAATATQQVPAQGQQLAGAQPEAGPAVQVPAETLRNDFDLARTIDTREAWVAFLDRHGSDDGNFYVQLANAALAKLNEPAGATGQQAAKAPAAGDQQSYYSGAQPAWGGSGGTGTGASQQPAAPAYQDPFAALTAMELQDFGVPATRSLHMGAPHGPTPTDIPGGRIVTTAELVEMTNRGQDYLLLDVLGGAQRLPNAAWAVPAAQAGSFNDLVQQNFGQYLSQATGGNPDMPIVLYCGGVQCWMSYNAALRAINLGYRNVLWYRGGTEAWQSAGGYLVPWQ